MSTLENCLVSTYLLWFSTRVKMEKNWGDTPSATLMKFIVYIITGFKTIEVKLLLALAFSRLSILNSHIEYLVNSTCINSAMSIYFLNIICCQAISFIAKFSSNQNQLPRYFTWWFYLLVSIIIDWKLALLRKLPQKKFSDIKPSFWWMTHR